MARPDGQVDLSELEAPEWLLRHVAHLERRAWTAEMLSKIALVAALVTILLAGGFGALAISNAVDSDELKEATDKVALDSCLSQNSLRRTLRLNLNFQIKQTKPIPPEAFELFDIPKPDALHSLRTQRGVLKALNCARRLQPIRRAG